MKVLSLCGGGTSGYMTACFLSLIEKEIGKKIQDIFDFYAGTSTGSLVCGSLLVGKTPEEIKELYKNFHYEIFGSKKSFIVSLFKPMFNKEKFAKICNDTFGDIKLHDINKFFMAISLKLNKPELKPKFWKNWDAMDMDIRLSDCVIASASFPTGFVPHEIEGNHYYDGGLSANDPSLCALADAVSLLNADPYNIKMLTIQTDFHAGFESPEKFGGMLSVIRELPSLAVDSSERIVEYIINRIYGKKIATYITPKVYFPVDSNEWDKMENIVNITWNNQKEEILKFFQ